VKPNPETHRQLVDALCKGYVFDTEGAEAMLKEYVAPLQELAEIGHLAVEERRHYLGNRLLSCNWHSVQKALYAAVTDYLNKHPTGPTP
jgi:hypothetical protein